MTERLSQLLAGEADGLDVPPPATDSVLRQGRGLRRRNRVVVGACGLAAAIVVGGSVAALAGGGTDKAGPDPAGTTGTSTTNPVFSYGNEVFYDGPGRSAAVEDMAVKSLYYTSAGVAVRAGDNSYSDGGGEQRFSLITPDGDVRRLSLVTEETVHASDPEQPYVVYAEAVDGQLQVVVYDVETDAEAARVTVGPTKQTWFPVALDGDTAYVQDGYGKGVYAVDWAAGTVDHADLETVWEIAGGNAGTTVDGKPAVVDLASGDVLVTTDGPGYFDLSPDGRYAQLVDEEQEAPSTPVYDVATGESITLDGQAFDWGWTADGNLFKVEKTDVRTCDPGTGECTTEPYAKPAVVDPPPVTETVSSPNCPAGQPDCYMDNDFMQNCYDHPDQCEWSESTSVDDQSPELRLGGRAYES